MTSSPIYDAANNRRRNRITISPSGLSADCKAESKTTEIWNLFDDADRVKLGNAILTADGRIQLAPARGLELKHENGFRVKETMIDIDPRVGTFSSDIAYDDNGLLKSTVKRGILKVELGYSGAGYADSYNETCVYSWMKIQAKFNENAWKHEEISDLTGKKSIYNVREFFQIGVPKIETIRDESGGALDERECEYLRAMGTWNLITVKATRTYQGAKGPVNIAEYCLDSNGTINGKFNSDDEPYRGSFRGQGVKSMINETVSIHRNQC